MKQHWNVVYDVCLLYHVRTKWCFRNMPYVNETNKAIQVISKISKEIGHNLHSNVLHLSGSCVFAEDGGEMWLLRRKKCICLEPKTVCVLSSLLSSDFFLLFKISKLLFLQKKKKKGACLLQGLFQLWGNYFLVRSITFNLLILCN